ncbi:hypothetical protein L204_102963 [Cryptococcus depauperatus]
MLKRATLVAGSCVLILALHTKAFSFSTGTPTQCGNLTVQWDGGSPPFQLHLVPTVEVAGGHIESITIPQELQKPYTFSFNLDQPAGLNFIMAMSDASGFGTGGTTPVLTVGSSDHSTCVPSMVNADFFFSVSPNSNPQSCSSMSITWASNATDPTTLYGMIPHGTAFQIPIDDSGTSKDWTVNIASGTQFLLMMRDAGPYGTGGSTGLYTVQSGNTGCLNASSPASAASVAISTSSSAVNTASVSGVGGTSSGDSAGHGRSNGQKIGAIVGGTLGGFFFLVLLGLLLFFCIRRRTQSSSTSDSSGVKSYGFPHEKGKRRHTVDLMDASEGGEGEEQMIGDDNYQLDPFRYPSPHEISEGYNAGTSAATERNAEERPLSWTGDKIQPSTNTSQNYQSFYNGVDSSMAPTVATVGHETANGPTIRRENSMRKSTVSQFEQRRQSETDHRVENEDENEHVTRFVQHEDAGKIVDLPPRYDQLKARNPDQ